MPSRKRIVPIRSPRCQGSKRWRASASWPGGLICTFFHFHRHLFLQNLTEPTPEICQPAGKANGTATAICPGSGYQLLTVDHEWNDVARWLTSFGVTAFVLKYGAQPTEKRQRVKQDE